MQYYIGKNGQQVGPFGLEQVRERLASGEFSPTDLAWCDGMAGWEPLSQIFNNPYQPSLALGQSPLFSQNSGSLRLAGAGSRLGAYLLDSLFGGVAMIPAMIGWFMIAPAMLPPPSAASSGSVVAPAGGAASPLGMGLIGLGVILALAFFIYQLFLLSTKGQTLGKKILGVRIVTFEGGENPGFVKAVLLRAFVPALISMIPLVGFIFAILDPCFIFREDRRCIHDLIANTRVVEA